MNRKIFFALNITWGLPMNILGLLVALGLRVAGNRPQRYGDCWCFLVGRGWGGVSFGLIMVVAENASNHTKNHEHGHAVQNAFFGVLMPFVVAAPSAIRYWYFNIVQKIGKSGILPPYDSVWFERQASLFGKKYVERSVIK